jgi:uncharacterized Ntn-hydrolase superfamily protein
MIRSVWNIRRSGIICAAAFVAATQPVSAQQPEAWRDGLQFGTFSIAAVDRETGEVGVAVTSRVPCVGHVVPHVRAGVGAVATQATARMEYGPELLDLMESGVAPAQALRKLTENDSRLAHRQIGVIGVDGRVAQHTGRETVAWAGHRSGRSYVTQGNLLAGEGVLRAVARTFEASEGSGRPLADRLIEALAAGVEAGGDVRKGTQESAAVVVADPRPGQSWRPNKVSTEISVCEYAEPVRELRRVYRSVTETLGYRPLQQFYGSDVMQLKIMLHALGHYRAGEGELTMDLSAPFYTPEAIAAVNAFREAEGLAGIALGTPPGFVDEELVARMWAALQRRGLADEVHRRVREMLRR